MGYRPATTIKRAILVSDRDTVLSPTRSTSHCSRNAVTLFCYLSRGDRRLTFPNEAVCTRLLWAAISQTQEFHADAFFALSVDSNLSAN
jgi:hypothetical protein